VVPTNSIIDKLSNYWGGKTGFTDEANEALLSIFEINDNSQKYPFVAIVIQSSNRFNDTQKISQWIENNKTLLTKN
jgi:D-alanyl-D-alanine carboxypeptidase